MARDLVEDDVFSSEDEDVAMGNGGFKVNEEFAKRFEHNKKREELAKCEYRITM